MIDRLANPSPLQRIARGALVVVCALLAVGVVGSVSARAVEHTARPAVSPTPVSAMAVAIPDEPALLITAERTPVPAETASLTRKPSSSKVLWMEVTAYCACKKCCGPGAKGITASGKRVSHDRGRFVAADTSVLPFGTKLSIPGYHGGRPVEVLDRGGAIKGHKLDVYFPSHQTALEWGRRHVPVTVVD